MKIEEIEPREVICRQSCMSCALKCERKWWYKYRMGIVLRGGEYKESATLGKIYHRLQRLGPGSEDKIKAEVQKQQQELMTQVDKGEDIDGQMQRTAGMLTTLYNKAVAMARVFWERYPDPSYFKVLGTEIKHRMEWEGLIFEGTIDKLLLNEQDGGIWIRDHKSTGMSLELIFSGLGWAIQGRMYRILAKDFLEKSWEKIKDEVKPEAKPIPANHDPKGFILDGILKPTIKLCKTDKKNAKDWQVSDEEAYLRRVKQWYGDQMEQAVRSRGMIFTEPLFPEEFRRVLMLMCTLQNFTPHKPELFHRDVTRTECFSFNRQCIYHDLCKTDPKQWGGLFETKYKVTEKREEDEHEEVDL